MNGALRDVIGAPVDDGAVALVSIGIGVVSAILATLPEIRLVAGSVLAMGWTRAGKESRKARTHGNQL